MPMAPIPKRSRMDNINRSGLDLKTRTVLGSICGPHSRVARSGDPAVWNPGREPRVALP